MLERIEKLKKIMQKNHLDAVFVNSYENRRYLSGFTGSNGYVFITSNDHSLITDQRYAVQANEQTEGLRSIFMELIHMK
ncbi:aminopeptidase P family N-terminal domain-containing protein [Guptibacillus hwajinpoensis]|uniref:aminopeptidase P family N-terminal domain-containing protein n=1 Tax=Guptibacillus hwajinpoensis TaxID=208199 RepID=UPI00210499D5|nr:aminopeptidase P family N-terminal domain-containing protein [Pseudalkalibacillus hwajinpoensis]